MRRFFSVGIVLFSRSASRQVSSAQMSLTSVFGMGTGGTSSPLAPAIQLFTCLSKLVVTRMGLEPMFFAVTVRRVNRFTNEPDKIYLWHSYYRAKH